MKKRKLRMLAIVAAIAITLSAALAFGACGDKKDGEEPEVINYTTYSSVAYVDGGTSSQVMDIHVPDTEDDSKMPLLVCIHGGMFLYGTTTMSTVANLYKYFGNRGYVCASLQYTVGASTYPAGVRDCKTAVQYLFDNAETYKIDTSKIVIYGESAGSYLACLAALSGPSDFKMNESDPDYTYEAAAYIDFYGPVMVGNGLSDSGAADWMGDAEAPNLSTYLEDTSVKYIWIQHGSGDPSVDYSHASSFRELVEETGKYSEGDGTLYYEIIEGAGHMDSAFFTEENLDKLYTWLGAALGV